MLGVKGCGCQVLISLGSRGPNILHVYSFESDIFSVYGCVSCSNDNVYPKLNRVL